MNPANTGDWCWRWPTAACGGAKPWRLRVRDVEFLRRRLSVSENAVQLGVWHAVGPTKGRKSRSVPAPSFVLDELSVQCAGKVPGDLVFAGPDGGYLQRPKSATGGFRPRFERPRCRR